MLSYTLIHTALLCEAQTLINFLKLKQDNSIQNLPKKSKLFLNENTILIVSGIGKENTIKALDFIFSSYEIKKAFNIGIAGCTNKSIEIAELFCVHKSTNTSKKINNIKEESITTLNTVCSDISSIKTTLVDMECEYFIEECKKNIKEFYVFKVVSDYCESKIPKKSFVISLIQNSFSKWNELL